MINYEDTSHKVLGLAVSDFDLDVSNLSVISTQKVGDFEFGVLGASHFFKMRNGSNIITEVFACKKLEGDIRYYPLESLVGQKVSTENNSFVYDFKVELIEDKKFIDALIGMFDEAVTKNDGHNLAELFPTKEELPFKACTNINVKEYKSFIRVQTLHTYPEEGIIVYTESKIKRK